MPEGERNRETKRGRERQRHRQGKVDGQRQTYRGSFDATVTLAQVLPSFQIVYLRSYEACSLEHMKSISQWSYYRCVEVQAGLQKIANGQSTSIHEENRGNNKEVVSLKMVIIRV